MSRDQGVRPVTVPTVTAGNTSGILVSACRFYGWSLGDAGNPATAQALSTTVAAAAAGTLTLTLWASVNIVTVTPVAAWPAGTNTVTVSNINGGTQSVEIQGGTTNPAQLLFPGGVGITGTAVVSVPAMVGGPAYSISAEGTLLAAAPQAGLATCQILDGSQLLGVSAPLSGVTDTQWLADKGIYVGTGISVKCIAGAVSGVIYIMDGTEIPLDSM